MDICICDITELECLRAMFAPNAPGCLRATETQLSVPAGTRFGPALAARVRMHGAASRRLHVVLPPGTPRIRRDDVVCHKYAAPKGEEHFVDFGSGVAGLPIEHFYVLICRRLTFVQRLQLAFELCGWYAIIPNPAYENEEERLIEQHINHASEQEDERDALQIDHRTNTDSNQAGDIVQKNQSTQVNSKNSGQNAGHGAFKTVAIERPPLTTVQKLRDFAASNPGIRGSGLALKALRFAADNARSPQEAKLAIAMSLPYHMGGYNRGPLLMDYLVEGTNGMRRCDCFLLDGKVDVEYGSTQHHDSPQAMQADSQRTNELSARGINVVNITSKELRDPHLFHVVMQHLARVQKRPLRIRINDFASRRNKLWAQLFPELRLQVDEDR